MNEFRRKEDEISAYHSDSRRSFGRSNPKVISKAGFRQRLWTSMERSRALRTGDLHIPGYVPAMRCYGSYIAEPGFADESQAHPPPIVD